MNRHPAPRSLWRSVRELAPYCRAQRRDLVRVALLGASSATLSALEPLALERLFNRFLAQGSLRDAALPFGLFIGILCLRELLGLRQDRVFWRARLGISFSLLSAMIDHLHRLPLGYHRETSVGATMTKVERGVSGVTAAFSDFAVQLFPALIYLCVSAAVMFRMDARLSLTVLLFAPLPALIGAFASREQTEREHQLMQRWTRIFSRFNEALSGILVVKSFVMEDRERQRFLGGVGEANQLVLRGVATDSRYNALRNGIITLARIISIGFGGVLVMRGEIGVGTLVAFLAYLGGVFQPVQALTGMYQTLRRATVSAECVLSILEAHVSVDDEPGARDAERLRGEVELRDVGFGYRPGQPLLQHIDLHARPGEMIAIVGPSGAGKSTLMALLQRLYAPSTGSILLDGQDVRGLTQRSVREQIAVVLQEGMLFSDSIRDNIAFGRPSASQAEVEAAARAAGADDFIRALPEGYDTPVGERGSKLSGGERQRIAIARALLKDAPILVLDEATSALDADNEQRVQEALGRLRRGRTTFVIAHRLSTIRNADRILVLRDGAIAESGTHDELVRAGGYYARVASRHAMLDASGDVGEPASQSYGRAPTTEAPAAQAS
jgi:ATP-binding cassette subfamily B protein